MKAWSANSLLFALLLLLFGCAETQPRHDQEGSRLAKVCRELVEIMGDQSVDLSIRYHAEAMLLACPDKEGIHALIIALDDKRVFNPSAALPSGNPSTSPDRMVLTVGKRAEQVLPDIIGCDKFSRYRVSDWRQWWTANQNKSLDEIRDEVKLVNSQK